MPDRGGLTKFCFCDIIKADSGGAVYGKNSPEQKTEYKSEKENPGIAVPELSEVS